MKKVEDLVPGDVLVQDGVRFVVKTVVYFEDMPATEEIATSFRKLTEVTGGTGLLPPVKLEQKGWQNSKLRQVMVQEFEKNMKSHPKGEGKMEIREWMYIAVAWGGRLRGNMVPDKAYLYELYTETFVQFDSREYAEAFIEWAKKNIDHWGHDPIALLDTSDPEVRERWAGHMAKSQAESDKIMMPSTFEAGGGVASEHLRETFAPGEMKLGSMRWWKRTPMTKKDITEAIVVVEGGMVTGVYSDKETLLVSVLDLDSDDPSNRRKPKKAKQLLKLVSNGES